MCPLFAAKGWDMGKRCQIVVQRFLEFSNSKFKLTCAVGSFQIVV